MSDEKQAGAWVITDVFSKHGVRITVKASGANVNAAVDDLYQGIAHGIDTYGWTVEQTNAPKQAAPASSPAPAPQSVVGALPIIDTSINTMEIVKVSVAPQQDGKIKIGLFWQGHKYADLFMTMGLDATLKALANTGFEWTAEFLSKPAEFDMHFYADWRNSEKLNSKGNPYKNIVALRPIDATA